MNTPDETFPNGPTGNRVKVTVYRTTSRSNAVLTLISSMFAGGSREPRISSPSIRFDGPERSSRSTVRAEFGDDLRARRRSVLFRHTVLGDEIGSRSYECARRRSARASAQWCPHDRLRNSVKREVHKRLQPGREEA